MFCFQVNMEGCTISRNLEMKMRFTLQSLETKKRINDWRNEIAVKLTGSGGDEAQ